MNTALISTVLLSILRHGFTAYGGSMLADKHAGALESVAGALAVLVPALFSIWKAKRDLALKIESTKP